MAVDLSTGLRVGQGHQVLAFLDGLCDDRDHEALGSTPKELGIARVRLGGLEVGFYNKKADLH